MTIRRITETATEVERKATLPPPLAPLLVTTPILVGVGAEDDMADTIGTGIETETTIGETEIVMDIEEDGARTAIATTHPLAMFTIPREIMLTVGGATAITATTGKREEDIVVIVVGVVVGVAIEAGTGDTHNREVCVLKLLVSFAHPLMYLLVAWLQLKLEIFHLGIYQMIC